MLYNAPSGSLDPNADYVGKDVAAGRQGSKIPPKAVMTPQRELVALIKEAGLGPTNDDLTQVLKAIRSGKLWTFADTGTLNHIAVAALTPHSQSFLGLPLRIFPKFTNTDVVDLSLNGLSPAPVLRRDGTQLQAGDIVANVPFDVVGNGLGSYLHLGLARSEAASAATAVIAAANIVGGGKQTWASAGTYTWVVPVASGGVPAVTKIGVLDCIGGGGGGGGASGTNAGGSGGGGAGDAKDGVYPVTPGETLTIVVGAQGVGGVGGATPGNGGTGGTTYIMRQNGTVLCSASGGGGGYAGNGAPQQTSRGVGGSAVGGARNYPGSGGGFPISYSANLIKGGEGGPSGGGACTPQTNNSAPGLDGQPRGGGANGSSSNGAGGTGGAGELTISF